MCILAASKDIAYSGPTDYANLWLFTVYMLKPFINTSLSADCLFRAFGAILHRTVGKFGLRSAFNPEQIGTYSTQGTRLTGKEDNLYQL